MSFVQVAPNVAQNVMPEVVEEDMMDVPFEELIGLRGPWRQLFENAATVLASTFVFLLAMLWVPFMLGSIIMAAITRALYPTT